MDKSCENCVNRLICPTRRLDEPLDICSGYNDEGVFTGLLSLAFHIDKPKADDTLKFIKKLQGEK